MKRSSERVWVPKEYCGGREVLCYSDGFPLHYLGRDAAEKVAAKLGGSVIRPRPAGSFMVARPVEVR